MNFRSAYHPILLPLASRGKFVEAEQLCKGALAINTKVYGSDHSEVATDLFHLTDCYVATVRRTFLPGIMCHFRRQSGSSVDYYTLDMFPR